MANSAGITNSFKLDLLGGIMDLGGADVYRMALYLTTASISPSTTAYTATGELAATGNYTAKGETFTNGTPALDSTTAHWTPSTNVQWTSFTSSGSFDCALLFNDDDAGDASVASFTFASQSVTSGTFTLTMPTDDGTTGLIRID